ncbi:hypothetical protein ACQCWI_16025 [Bacillus thuringiensis]|uniref:hypothetical protein n=1 Tax=Bacillus cereus group TaxID=86661 RepID=UPI0015D5105E|nr:hypothetical protein [Bacillus toyonensis]
MTIGDDGVYNYYGYIPFLRIAPYRRQKALIISPSLYEINPRRTLLYTNMNDVITQNLGNGFTRYTWANIDFIKPQEYVEYQLITPFNEEVISAGFSSFPLTNIYPIQIAPIFEQTNIMVVILHNRSESMAVTDLWVITKKK